MAMMATCPDLTWDSWLAQSQLHHHAVPDDIWSKFGFGQEKAVALPNPTVDTHLSPFDMGTYVGGVGSDGEGMNPMGALPTPPHSPPTEHDLDDLVASIPEILESPSASPPSDISIILSDLEGMDTTPLGGSASPASRMEGGWGTDWWGGVVAAPAMEASLKRDIMWGAGVCNNNGSNIANSTSVAGPTTPTTTSCADVVIKKERQESECSTDAVLRDVIRADDLSEDSDDSDDNMPDTPSGTDSDCDADDQLSETWSSASPRSTSSPAARHTTHAPPSVNSEHNYCGRVPEPDPHHHHNHHHHHPAGTITPSDTEDEVDVVSCVEQNDVPRPSSTTTTHSIPSAATTTTTTRLHLPPPKHSADVKKQLQQAIHEAMRNRQNREVAAAATTTTGPAGCWIKVEAEDTASRLVSVKIKTQGKPAAYTKRMRDYHSEVVKSTKHRRRNRGESDEGRRSVHNSLERQRRVDLRNAFEYLRLLVPDTKVLEKAPKVQILKKAALHCKNLQHTEHRLLREKEKLKRQLEELQERKTLSS